MRPKGFLIAAYVPLHFALASGHLRSAIAGKAVTAKGDPLPWYTYPAINFVASMNFADARVLEFGGGQSTGWWADRAAEVVTVELDPAWRAHLERTVGHLPNVTIGENAEGGRYDVVIVDGGERYSAAVEAAEVVTDDGLVIFDNSEGYWGKPGTFPIIDLMNEQGFSRVDFHGYQPGVRRHACTSLFFKNGCRFLTALGPPPGLTSRQRRRTETSYRSSASKSFPPREGPSVPST